MSGKTLGVALAGMALWMAAPVALRAAEPSRLHDLRERHLDGVLQLTSSGENAEAYWAPDGRQLVLQSTHGDMACDQIFLLDPGGGGTLERVSSGAGRTTCGYFTADGERLLYSSTHASGAACPAPPDRSMGYVWAVYDTYEIFSVGLGGDGEARQLTDNQAYDAEATVCSRDGSMIFTSTRDGDLELYRMDANGGEVRRLTEAPGYDGGAFFSPDCSQIVWRASRPAPGQDLEDYQHLLGQGLVRPSRLEIWIADADGGNARQVTYLGAASFAPSFFPSGDRIMFSSNHGDAGGREFDLWAVNVDGTGLERITFTPGFDGFPMFSPDGSRLVFASNRNQGKPGETDVYVARWLPEPGGQATGGGADEPSVSSPADAYMEDVRWLADDARGGRGVGTPGLAAAADYIEERFRALGLEAAGASGFRQSFSVPVAVESGATTTLSLSGKLVDGDDFRPVGFSSSGSAAAAVVLAGHGITSEEHGLDDYAGIDARGHIVLVRRFTPEDGPFTAEETRRRLSDLRYKAWNAREHGAVALLVADLPAVGADDMPEEAPFPSLSTDGMGDAGIPVLMIKRSLAGSLASGGGQASLSVEMIIRSETAHNLVGRVRAPASGRLDGALLIGAHYDHLGLGGHGSLAPDVEEPHNGADDNASGTAALLAAARQVMEKQAELRRDVYFIAFAGEERGLLGSTTFSRSPTAGLRLQDLRGMINMDMVGRLRDNKVTVLGGDSAGEWDEVVLPACASAALACSLGGDGYGPSDQTPFYAAGIPVLHFFTGAHSDYHKPSDDAELINAAGGARIAGLVADLTMRLAARAEPLTYRAGSAPAPAGDSRSFGASLGTIPDYAGPPEGQPGVLLAGVRAGSAAEAGGLKRGDILVGLAGRQIHDIHDFVYILRDARPGEQVVAVVERQGSKLSLDVTFGRRSSRSR